MIPLDISKLHTNQRLMVEALLKKGASVSLLDSYEELLLVEYQGEKEFLMDRFSSKVPYHVVKMAADKFFTKHLFIQNNISTPKGAVFTYQNQDKAFEYVKQNLCFPLVLKPNWGSHGDHVKVDIQNQVELSLAIEEFKHDTHVNEAFILEQYYPWKEYRLFITSIGGFAVIHREWASIIGDGVHTIKELIDKENNYRIQLKKQQPTSLCPIVIDNEMLRYINRQNFSLNYILMKDQKIYLRNESNLAKGGRAIDCTDIIHPSYKKLALTALSCFPGLPCAGLDVLIKDLTQPFDLNNYVIIELNSSPGLAMHTYPTEGQSRNVADLLAQVMFPNWY